MLFLRQIGSLNCMKSIYGRSVLLEQYALGRNIRLQVHVPDVHAQFAYGKQFRHSSYQIHDWCKHMGVVSNQVEVEPRLDGRLL